MDTTTALSGKLAHRAFPRRYLLIKAYASPVIALVLCVFLVPVIALLYLLVRLTSRGPGFYSQVRLGLHGRRFTIYKLRTMVVDAEAKTGPVWASERDPRITPIGAILRNTHLDELPQIFNIILGDMCFVGPRPERPEIAATIEEQIAEYADRLLVKPGVTGMAQLHLPPDTCLDSVRRKLSYDRAYMVRGTVWLDIRVVFATLFRVVPFAARYGRRLVDCSEFVSQASVLFVRRQSESFVPSAEQMLS